MCLSTYKNNDASLALCRCAGELERLKAEVEKLRADSVATSSALNLYRSDGASLEGRVARLESARFVVRAVDEEEEEENE